MRYLPHTPVEIEEMLRVIDARTIDALFDPIPKEVRLQRPLAIEPSLDEASLLDELAFLAEKNRATRMLSFLGAGIYDHPVPTAVDQLLLRGEFYTAYTPYQAEVAQGTLQAIFEFQTIVCELFGMPVANASMYDGASAAAEAALMARRLTKRTHVLVTTGVHPEYAETIRTYVRGLPGGSSQIETVPNDETGTLDLAQLKKKLESGDGKPTAVACVVVGYPNFYGCIGDLRKIADICHEHGALLVTCSADPFSLALLEPPGALGVDIAVGEGQPLGVPPQNGGPGCGLFACRDDRAFLQQIPGRLCGETIDKNGQRGYVLTLATREQHIRRDRATSNICTNHSLCALAITIRMSLLGKSGFVEVAKQCLAKTEYLKAKLVETGAWELPFPAPTFNEFVARSKKGDVAPLLSRLENEGILAGVPIARFEPDRTADLLIAVTERHKRADLDRFVLSMQG
ncbi:MAG: aminomethyl-transferring glycine dehydrogenase subunit GcvPA [Polyangiaceae bacterium]